MKIVIDISEEQYKLVRHGNKSYTTELELMNAVANGTLLPKGHGRLIDISDIEPMSYTVDGGDYYDDYKAIDWEDIEKAPTIIEADTAESEEEV